MTKDEEEIAWALAKAFRKWERNDTGKHLLHFVEAAGLTVVKRRNEAQPEMTGQA